ncbi:Zn-dependent metalloprotease [Allocatelliglobosispora scoriae]|uniref:Zn-dependent metalloprotease n=1 Tax=Allocatelliglobosispora scoriae TaxID=643052 RepID=A0A841BMX7_9ACTN|nr:bacillolysin [Allocatelliglobosispora scoriae]MBB5870427.1 Zn-dependent metalloprotease [Allocatelliglobosispora scoriae]
MTPASRLTALISGATLIAAGLSAAPAAAAPAVPDGLTLVTVKHSLLGDHQWFQQTYRGLPVLGGFLVKHTETRSGAVTTEDGRLAVNGDVTPLAAVGADRARASAITRDGGQVTRSQLVVVPGAQAVLAWRVLLDTGNDSRELLVDARSGAVIRSESLIKKVNGSGKVFNPNPVVTLQNESLKDASNANSAVFAPAYSTVTLTQLNAGGKLKGAYASNASASAVTSTTNVFNYNRSQAGFEQVMVYYHLTRSQEYIQSLGFTDVNNSAQVYKTTGLTDDNSFYDPSTDRLTFGTGGVDDAEDAEVIWHEYGHAIQDDQVPGFGSGAQSGAIGEGFGDYWAYSMSSAVSANTATTPLACIADWDAVSYTSTVPHCLRRVDGTKVYPGDVAGEVHDDGEIWSRGLFDIFNALGRVQADRIILEAQFSFAPNTTFTAASNKIVAAAQALYGAAAAAACTTALHARGFI